jgi:Bacterial CdiA-CT RNAse A domain
MSMSFNYFTTPSPLIISCLLFAPVALQLVATNPVSSAMTCTFNLQNHEGGVHKGHTIDRHVNQSDSQLKLRLTNNPELEAVTTYASLTQAQSLTDSTICSDKAGLDLWLGNKDGKDGDRKTFSKTFSSVTGTLMKADGKAKIDVFGNLVVVQRNSAMPDKFGIVTSYPK